MRRKIICLLGAVCMMLSVKLSVGAVERKGSITVIPVWAGSAVTGETVQLRWVGNTVTEGFQLTDGLANWIVKEEEGTNRSLLNWLAQNGQEGQSGVVEQAGAIFTGLQEGIYLVTQGEAPEGDAFFAPLLVQLPEGEDWDITVKPQMIRDSENPQTGDHPAPIIGAMGIGLSAAVLMVLVEERRK